MIKQTTLAISRLCFCKEVTPGPDFILHKLTLPENMKELQQESPADLSHDLKYSTKFIKHLTGTLKTQVSPPALLWAVSLCTCALTQPWAVQILPSFPRQHLLWALQERVEPWVTEALTWESSREEQGWGSAWGREVSRRLIEGNDSLMVCTALEITCGHFLGKYLTVLSLFREKAKGSAGKRHGCLLAWRGWDAKIPAGRQREAKDANAARGFTHIKHFTPLKHSTVAGEAGEFNKPLIAPIFIPIFIHLLPKQVLELRRETLWKPQTYLCFVINLACSHSCLVHVSFPTIFVHSDFCFEKFFPNLILSLCAGGKGFLNIIFSNI